MTHSDTPHSVGLHWTRDQPFAEPLPDNTQHSRGTDIRANGGIENINSSRRAAVNSRPRLRLQRDLMRLFLSFKCFTVFTCELFALAEVVKIEKDTEILLFFGKRVGLGINARQSTEFRHQNGDMIFNTKRANKANIRLKLENRILMGS